MQTALCVGNLKAILTHMWRYRAMLMSVFRESFYCEIYFKMSMFASSCWCFETEERGCLLYPRLTLNSGCSQEKP